VDPGILVHSVYSFTFLHPSASIHCSVMHTDMSVRTDTDCPLCCMLAVDNLPLLNARMHLTTV